MSQGALFSLRNLSTICWSENPMLFVSANAPRQLQFIPIATGSPSWILHLCADSQNACQGEKQLCSIPRVAEWQAPSVHSPRNMIFLSKSPSACLMRSRTSPEHFRDQLPEQRSSRPAQVAAIK